MDNIILQLLYEWPELGDELNALTHARHDYIPLNLQLDEAIQQLEAALGDGGRELYLNFEEANNAVDSLCRDAAFLCGFRLCSRLVVQLLTA